MKKSSVILALTSLISGAAMAATPAKKSTASAASAITTSAPTASATTSAVATEVAPSLRERISLNGTFLLWGPSVSAITPGANSPSQASMTPDGETGVASDTAIFFESQMKASYKLANNWKANAAIDFYLT